MTKLNNQLMEKLTELDNINPKISTGYLPDGWEWCKWEDGSGAVMDSQTIPRYFFDRAPYRNEGGIEYRMTNGAWTIYYGSFEEFQQFIGEKIKSDLKKQLKAANKGVNYENII